MGAPGVGCRGRRPHERVRSPWLGLLPSTRLRVSARLAPAMTGGDRVAAVLRVRDQGVPEVVGEPSGAQRLAGRLRAGLREATSGLPHGCSGPVAGAGRGGHLADHPGAGGGLQGNRPHAHARCVRGQLHDPPRPVARAAGPGAARRAAGPRASSRYLPAGDGGARGCALPRVRRGLQTGSERAAGGGLRSRRAARPRDRPHGGR